MRIPYSWLAEYLPGLPPASELAQVLTLGGLEVEEVREWVAEDGSARDQVLLTSVTANRGDLLSVVGTARHAAALLGVEFHAPRYENRWTARAHTATDSASSGELTVEIQDPSGCPRYSGLLLQGVTVGPSPAWLQHRLEAAGLRSLGNVVDVTNYVCWELGQPMHAFDFRLLQAGHILVRRARPGEQLMLIDESVPALTEEDVVIADPYGAVALAGIMGGADSEMRDSTTAVLLEAAHFDPTAIRKTALRLGRSTEASYRFERHVDPNLTLPALARAAELILELAGGEVAGEAVDICTRPFLPREISLRPQRCNALLGTEIAPERMAEYLGRIGCQVEEGETLTVRVPTARWDVEREVDLIEEVAIVHGYQNLPTTLPGRLRASGRLTREQEIERRAREVLRRLGLNETLSFSLLCRQDLARLGYPEDEACRLVGLSNPLSAEAEALRTTLLPALLGSCAYNQRQRVRDIALYEINRVFFPSGEELPREDLRVAGVVAGSPWTAGWGLPAETGQVDFYWLKGLVEQLLAELGVAGITLERGEHPAYAAGACAQVRRGERSLGWLGEVAPAALAAYDAEGPVYAFELDFEAVRQAAEVTPQYRPLPRFPAALRDVAVALPDTEALSAAAVGEAIRQAAGELAESVRPFDVYVNPERLGAGRRSVAFELVFRAEDRTLTDEEVDTAMARVHQRLAELGGEVR